MDLIAQMQIAIPLTSTTKLSKIKKIENRI
jgi:hypothetical protein